MRERHVRLLAGLIVLDLVAGLSFDLGELHRFLAQQRDWWAAGTAAAIALSVGGLLAAAVVARSLAQARRDLHAREQALAADSSMSADWLWESDPDLHLTYNSPGVRRLLGYEPADLLGRSWLELLAPGDREIAQATVDDAVQRLAGWEVVERCWQRADGSEVLLQGAATPLYAQDGRLVGFRGVRRSLTQAEVADRHVAAARRRVGEVLERQAVQIALQPIVDLETGQMQGAEALARFHDGRPPDVWFAEARHTGQALALDQLAFRTALNLLDQVPAACYLSVNATPELLLSPWLTACLLEGGVDLERLVVEITEHTRIDDYDALHTALAPLRERGMRLAIDDTGAGYASLSHVLKLRPNIIKIDRSLVTNVTGDPARRSLVTALVLLALDLGASVTAEGVETPSELETVAALGADCGQGYLLGRPSTEPARWQRWGTRNWLAPTPKVRSSP